MTLRYVMFDRGRPCVRGLTGEHDCGQADAAREDFSHVFPGAVEAPAVIGRAEVHSSNELTLTVTRQS